MAHVVARYLIVLVATLSVRCSLEECEPLSQRCDGADRLICEARSCHVPNCLFAPTAQWRRERCKDHCVEVEQETFCTTKSVDVEDDAGPMSLAR